MPRRIFGLRGRVAWADGSPADGVFTAIVDADPDLDDLIAVARTNDDGSFRVTFLEEAFRQEPREVEPQPDIYIVVSIPGPAGAEPVVREHFVALFFDQEEDVGTITLPLRKGERPPKNPDLRAFPGRSKRVRRVHLDEEIVTLIASEMAPHVERFTGWGGLLDGIRFELRDTLVGLERRRIARALGREDHDPLVAMIEAEGSKACDSSTLAMWEPVDRVVYLNRPELERKSLDRVRLVIGHELVHVGQFREPSVRDTADANARAEWARRAGLADRLEDVTAVWSFMANIEGYARYIDSKFLAGIYTGAVAWSDARETAASHMDLGRQVRAAQQKLATTRFEDEKDSWGHATGPHDLTVTKNAQYEAGMAAYLARTTGGIAAPFDPALRPAPQLDRAALDRLSAAALEGCAASAMSIGLLLIRGDGIEKDVETGVRYLRMAADRGLPAAAYNLARHLESGDPEKLRRLVAAAEWGLPWAMTEAAIEHRERGELESAGAWARKAADTGLSAGQALFGAFLLGGVGMEADPVAARGWLEKAGEAGALPAMELLVLVHRNGLGGKPDAITARIWEKRVEKAKRAKPAS